MCAYGHQGGEGEETLGARQPFAGAILLKATFRVAFCVLGTLIHIAWHIVGRKCKLILIYMLHLFIFVTLTLRDESCCYLHFANKKTEAQRE